MMEWYLGPYKTHVQTKGQASVPLCHLEKVSGGLELSQ